MNLRRLSHRTAIVASRVGGIAGLLGWVYSIHWLIDRRFHNNESGQSEQPEIWVAVLLFFGPWLGHFVPISFIKWRDWLGAAQLEITRRTPVKPGQSQAPALSVRASEDAAQRKREDERAEALLNWFAGCLGGSGCMTIIGILIGVLYLVVRFVKWAWTN